MYFARGNTNIWAHKLAIRWYKIYDPTSSDKLTRGRKPSNGRVLGKKINRLKVTFLSAIFPHQMRPSDAKSEKLFEKNPGSVPLLCTVLSYSSTRPQWPAHNILLITSAIRNDVIATPGFLTLAHINRSMDGSDIASHPCILLNIMSLLFMFW